MDKPDAPLIQGHRPANFVERGVAAPFTTPMLAGARIRGAERTGTEFVVPNPAGGRGVYILTWSAVRQMCKPTVHDTLLHQRVSRLAVIDPAGVRATARKLATEGLAGREALVAAAAAEDAEKRELILTNFLLLVTLMEQVEPSGLRVSSEIVRTPELDLRARRITRRIATTLGRPVTRIGEDLEALSVLFVPPGLRADMPPARLPRLLTRLETCSATLRAWARTLPQSTDANLALSLARSAEVTATCASATLSEARALADDVVALLRLWGEARAEVANKIGRAEWILDGWERFCLLWETAEDVSARKAALLEMAQLAPMLPKEGIDLDDHRQELEELETRLRTAQLNLSWRGGGAMQGLTARNERLQALIV